LTTSHSTSANCHRALNRPGDSGDVVV
jgi:hypothetical protein